MLDTSCVSNKYGRNILYGSINRFLKATNRFTKEFKELRYKIRRYVDLHKNEQYQD
jgi:hypothetical protein